MTDSKIAQPVAVAVVDERPSTAWIVLITLGNFLSHAFCALAITAAVGFWTWAFHAYFDNVDAELPPVTMLMLDCHQFV